MARSSAGRVRWEPLLYLILVIGLLALAGVAAVGLYELRYEARVYKGVRVAGVSLSGLTLEETVSRLSDELSTLAGEPIIVRYGDRSWSLFPADLGVSIDARDTAYRAYAIGREGTGGESKWNALKADLSMQWKAYASGYSVTPTVSFDEAQVLPALRRIAGAIDLPPQEGELTFSGLEVKGTAGSSGLRTDVERAAIAVADLARRGVGGVVDLQVTTIEPAVGEVDTAVRIVETLISEPVTLVVQGVTEQGMQDSSSEEKLEVDRAMLRSWLTFTPQLSNDGNMGLAVTIDRDRIAEFLAPIAKTFERPAVDAVLDFDVDKAQVAVISPSQTGQTLDVETSADAIVAALALPEPQRTITLPVHVLSPIVDSSKIDEMGIVEQVSEGTTYFTGSSADRVHNIANAAEKFQGVVVPPGEVFSFNKYVGEITTANGFTEGLIIWGDRTAVGIGGGVCQVSTTVFRAAFFGGFPIVERHAHGYIVSWYGEPGLDATIYTPDVDLRFENDTGFFLLIEPEVDTANGRITFHFYGTKPERTVEMDKPIIQNVQAPEAPLYQEDSTLAAGTITQVDWAKNGEDVTVKRRITQSDGTVTEETFVSNYQPWRAVFLYGTGTELPGQASDQSETTPEPSTDATDTTQG